MEGAADQFAFFFFRGRCQKDRSETRWVEVVQNLSVDFFQGMMKDMRSFKNTNE
jgi:hypothetical protein